ncbi:S8 family serine peptidase, partial [Planctomycetota bacterium]
MVSIQRIAARRWFLLLLVLLLPGVWASGDEFIYLRGRRVALRRGAERVVVHRGAKRRRIEVTTRQGARALHDRGALDFEGPLYQLGDAPVAVTDEIIVQYRRGVDGNAIRALHERLGVEVARVKARRGLYVVRLKRGSRLSPLAVANRLFEDGKTAFAHPNFVTEKVPLFTPNDPMVGDQWHLENDGVGTKVLDADVDASAAWDVTQGDVGIRIAVLDDGVEILHEDLASQVLDAFDFWENDSNPTAGQHGTSVAGVAAAAWNNGVGVSGAAANCKLTACRWGLTVEDDADMFYWAAGMLAGPPTAPSQGADVITNSWAFITRVCPDAVKQAIEDVATNGRGGKGCVVLFAAGNENEEMRALSCAALPFVIAVGASTSEDGRSYYSNYGRNLAFMSPSNGGSEGITTTDRTGSLGYSSGNYTSTFGGTSSATPLAAGVAGLVLSVNPNLTASQVKSILEHTTDKIQPGSANYDPVTGHSYRYGHGRINAANAVGAANAGTTWPRPVTNLAIEEVDGQLDLSWENPTEDVADVLIVSDTSPITWAPTDGVAYTIGQNLGGSLSVVERADVESFLHTPLTNGVRRYYALFVRNAA